MNHRHLSWPSPCPAMEVRLLRRPVRYPRDARSASEPRTILVTMTAFMTQDDFLRALREHPEWRQAVRTEILGEELLSLPDLVKENSRQIAENSRQIAENSRQVAALTERMDENSRQIAALTERMDRVEAQIAALTGEVRSLRDDVGDLKGRGLEEDLRRGPRRFLTQYRGIRAMDYDERYDMTDVIESESERREVNNLDAILVGNDPGTGQQIYVVVEASWTPNRRDLERVRRRAELLARATHVPVLALVAYEKESSDNRLAAKARELGVTLARKDSGVTVVAPLIVSM